MTLANFAVKRPVTILMVVAAIILFGAISMERLGLDMLPNLQIPIAAIVTLYPNADPESVEQDITIPVEGAVGTIGNLRRLTSMSMENISIVITELNWGTDVDRASDDIRSKLDLLSWRLPDTAQKPMVLKLDPSQLPLMMFSVSGSKKLPELISLVRDVIKPQLEQLSGVANVTINGAGTQAVEIAYDPAKLNDAGVNPMILQQLLQYQNLIVPAGPIVEDGIRYATRVGKPLQPEEIEELIIGYQTPGTGSGEANPFSMLVPQVIRLGDVAEVKTVYAQGEGHTRINGEPGILISVLKKSGENSVSVARSVRNELEKMSGIGADIKFVFDQSRIITKVIYSLGRNIIIGGFLALAVLWLFLRSVSSTLIISVAIPLSLVVTGVFMYFAGLTLNLMTLGGLGLGVGMLVDNAIVVLENIYRRRQMGEAAVEAATKGSGEVGRAITASTVTTLAVFLPVVFLRSIAGELFEEMALTVSFSLLASLLVALSVVPLLASRYLKDGKPVQKKGKPALFPRLQERYCRALAWGLDHKRCVFVLLGLILLATAAAYPFLEYEFLPQADEGQFVLNIVMPAGTPAPVTNEVAREVEKEILELPELEVVSTSVGSTDNADIFSAMMGTTSNRAVLTVTLLDRPERKRRTSEVIADLRKRLQRIDDEFPEAKITLAASSSMGSDVGDFLGESVTVEVKGRDYETSAKLARQFMERLEETPGFVDIDSSLVDTEPLLILGVNRAKALMGGLTVGQIGGEIRSARVGNTVTTLNKEGRSIPVVLKAIPDSVDSLADLKKLSVTSLAPVMEQAASVELGKVLEVEKISSPMTIQRSERQRVVSITANLEGLSLGDAETEVKEIMVSMDVPPGYSVNLAGVHQLMKDSFADLRLALVLAALLVYMVMASQFESLISPFIIIFSLPLAAIGVLWFLLLAGQSLGVMAYVGMIILAGIAVNNAIVIVDFTNQLIEQGHSVREAIISAGRARLRPVLMTALTTILGLLPLALGWGEGAEMQAPLAITVIGGLVTSTVLILFVIPVVYEIVAARSLHSSHD